MINKWVLNNFKSIGEEKELLFRPLTIFTGANSSGKSTVLQSILLVTQTLQNPIVSHPIVLNGYIKKFGAYGDIVNGRDNKKDVKIGFEIKEDKGGIVRMSPFERERINTVSSVFSISAKSENDLHPFLKELSLNSVGNNRKSNTLRLKRKEKVSDEIRSFLKNVDGVEEDALKYGVESDSFGVELSFLDEIKSKEIFCSGLRHFLPESSLICFTNRRERLKNCLRDIMLSNMGRIPFVRKSNDYNDIALIEKAIQDKLTKIIDGIVAEKKRSSDRNDRILSMLWSVPSGRIALDRFVFFLDEAHVSDGEKMRYLQLLVDELDKIEERYDVDSLPNFYNAGIVLLNRFFCDRIKYLGPLREEPKSVYPIESNFSIDNVGLRGENTAAVYENNKKRKVEYFDPTCFEKCTNITECKKKGCLSDAINCWLKYFGVANNVTTKDMGKFGHELKISTGKLEQDLTHVGVGVSQVLPILVMCLLAKKGDTIILEQPELHLHPKVQARLADFFISMNALGKQCIVETHSEYMINRLRLLVAKSDDTKISDDTMIYFVEKDKENGCSNYREITINPYGKIDKWPEGFFDESEDLASQIIEAAYEKKRREKMAK